MDNLSHALAGLAAGEILHRLLPAESDPRAASTRHRLLLVTAALAGNFPDLDLVLTPLLPAPLGYLLHHRGHTHTLLYALPQMLLLAAAMLLAWPGARRQLTASRVSRTGFLFALALGFGLHLAMDYLNSYGLHPFHPFDAGWLYGDMVFILEPMFWIALGAPLAMTISSRRWRLLWLSLLLAVPLYFTVKSFLSWYALAVLYAVAAFGALAQLGTGPRGCKGLAAGITMLCVFVGVQAAASRQAGQVVRAAMQMRAEPGVVHDVALTAFPSHPVCWVFAAIESSEGKDEYRLARGVVSLAPDHLPAAACPQALNILSGSAGREAVVFVDDTRGSLKKLRETQAQDCFFDAWLRFARMPLLEEGVASDLRFRSSARGNFTEMDLSDFRSSPCPENVPQWRHPRADLLNLKTLSDGNDFQ
ncbi:metal-dependent hydrolase [Noviherbaspirillum aridicola]|uniref:Inner membrane protein n=1 Tax=Noviherbaspirillum aridicola TaxID=2849687 RepID=A0ABQ4Q823_9BURK|nr:metal-dependent hydrolase [Noviherbaspirillum aridicola]GIZ52864.1 hypothetical protein NCCP691_28780 [Noviherbaspirillum aridicola]